MGRGCTTARGTRRHVISAAKEGHLEILQWARKHDCPLAPWVMCAYAAAGAGTWKCSGGSGRRRLPGERVERRCLHAAEGGRECCSGRGSTTARGTLGRVRRPQAAHGQLEVVRL